MSVVVSAELGFAQLKASKESLCRGVAQIRFCVFHLEKAFSRAE